MIVNGKKDKIKFFSREYIEKEWKKNFFASSYRTYWANGNFSRSNNFLNSLAIYYYNLHRWCQLSKSEENRYKNCIFHDNIM